MTKDEKIKSLENTEKEIEKEYGKGSIMKFGDGPVSKIESISTGSISLDYAIGVGGFPKGRITEIYGPESSGKTTLCLHAIAEVQKAGGLAAFIDTENALDIYYAQKLGVNLENLRISQPDDAEQALGILDKLIKSNAMDLIVLDSIAALVPRAEVEGDVGDSHMGLIARMMNQSLRKTVPLLKNSNVAVIFTNQIREKIGVMFGTPETTPGGNGMKFAASVRLDIRRREALKNGTEIIGNHTKVKVVKNKVAPPFKEAEFDIIYNEGISKITDLINLAVDLNIVQKAGAWLTYKEQRVQGKDALKILLKDDDTLLNQLRDEVKNKLNF